MYEVLDRPAPRDGSGSISREWSGFRERSPGWLNGASALQDV